MYVNPKETAALRLDATMKRRSRELLALQMTALEGMSFAAGIPPEGKMGDRRLPGWPWAPFLGKAPCPLEHAETASTPMQIPCGHGRTVSAA